MNNKSFGKHLKLAREKKNLSVTELASRVNVTNDTIRALESGKRSPGIDTFTAIFRELNINPDYFLSSEFEPSLFEMQKKSPELLDGILQLTDSELMRIEDIVEILLEEQNKSR